jgi:hypothetical protein
LLKTIGDKVIVENPLVFIHGNQLQLLFKGLQELAYKASLSTSYYSRLEPWVSSFEQAIHNLDPRVYETIISRSCHQSQVDRIMQQADYALVVMDGMSLREAFPLAKSLKEKWEVNLTYEVGPLPTDTCFFTLRYMNANAPSELRKRENPDFDFEEIVNKEDLSRLGNPTKTRFIVWVREPDKTLHEFKERFRMDDLDQAYQKTHDFACALFPILMENFERIQVTSDHGYVTDPHSWTCLENFPSDLRYASDIPDSIKQYCEKCGEFWLLKGRYNTLKRGKHGNVRHGGLSIMESIVPLITVARSQ